MKGKWDAWYRKAGVNPQAYANTPTYKLGADWLRDCALVEDWGCGLGWARQFVHGKYRGIDGTDSPFCDVVADLREYRSEVPGIFMRGVLEHNYDWRTVLDNALASFQERMSLILFVDPEDEQREMPDASQELLGVPTLAIDRDDLYERIDPYRKAAERLVTAAAYGVETVFYLER